MSRDRAERFAIRSRLTGVALWFAVPFLLAGLGLLAITFRYLLFGSRGPEFWYVVFFPGLMGSAFTAVGIFSLPKYHRVRVEPEEGRVLWWYGAPLRRKTRHAFPFSSLSRVRLTKVNARSHRSRSNLFGFVSESEHFRDEWRVALDGSSHIFASRSEERARRLAEATASAASIPLIDETGAKHESIEPDALDRPVAERVAAEEKPSSGGLALPPGIARSADERGVRYRGRTGLVVTGRYWRVRIESGRVGVVVRRLGLGWWRYLSLQEVEHVRRDHRLLKSFRGAFGTGRKELHVVRVVSDRKVLEIPLLSDVEAKALEQALLADIRAGTGT